MLKMIASAIAPKAIRQQMAIPQHEIPLPLPSSTTGGSSSVLLIPPSVSTVLAVPLVRLIWGKAREAVEVGGGFKGTLSRVQGAGEPPIATLPIIRRL